VELRAQCLEKLGRISEAVVEVAEFLADAYKMGSWPEDLLSRWIALFKSCPPIQVDEFYNRCAEMDNYMAALLGLAIEKGCQPPVGYPGLVVSDRTIGETRIDGRSEG